MEADLFTKEWMERFHAHLDRCEQCREHPFGLCPIGAKLLTGDDKKPHKSAFIIENIDF